MRNLTKHLRAGHAISDYEWLVRGCNNMALIHGVLHELVCSTCDAPTDSAGRCVRCGMRGGRWYPCAIVAQDGESRHRRIDLPMQALVY